MTHAHYSVRGFDRATRASGIVLMKPFPSQTPSVFPLFTLRPVPAMMQREKNFRLMAQIMELPRRKDHHVWPKRYSGREESEKDREGTMSPIDGNFAKTWNSFIIFCIEFLPLRLGGFRTGYETTGDAHSRIIGPIIDDWDPQIYIRIFPISFDRLIEVTAWQCLNPRGENNQEKNIKWVRK